MPSHQEHGHSSPSTERGEGSAGIFYQSSGLVRDIEELEGTEKSSPGGWGEYPLDNLAIRSENRTAFDVIRRVKDGRFILDPEFQRDMVWDRGRQSRLIESILLRIPLPVFYVAEDEEGRLIVVDGLQRLTTIKRFIENDLKLVLPDRKDLNGKRHKDLELRLQARVDDCQLLFFIIDFTVPDRARLDIFERVNSGVELTRQQMRNALFNGPATIFLREAASTDLFIKATNNGLDPLKMQDREFVNRFCSFMLLERSAYRSDMDDWLANGLRALAKSEGIRRDS